MTFCINRRFLRSLLFAAAFASTVTHAAHPLEGLQPGHWYEVPNSRMQDVYADPKAGAVMSAWGGGAYDSKRNLFLAWGGGHADYWGNEVYAFNVDTLQWSRLNEPSCNEQTCPWDVAYYPDGRPTSRHTYNNLQFIPSMDRLVSVGIGSAWGSGNFGSGQTDAFNLASRSWEKLPSRPKGGSSLSSISAYDPATGKVFSHASGTAGLTIFDPATSSWSGPFGSFYLPLYSTAAIDPDRRIMVALGTKSGVKVWNLDKPGSPSSPEISGAAEVIDKAWSPGFEYDPTMKKFVAWIGAATGGSVFVLDPDTWSLTEVAPAPTNAVLPSNRSTNGTFGRFRYIPKYDAYILVNRGSDNVYFYKLNKKADLTPPPLVRISASPSSVASAGERTTLAWSVSNADRCEAQGAWSGPKALAGSQSVVIQAESTFSLYCVGKTGKTDTGSVTVSVSTSKPTVNISATPVTVSAGGVATLSWTTTGASNCTAAGDWSGSRSVSGSQSVGPIPDDSSYSLTCTGPGGSATDSVDVTVGQGAPVVRLSATPSVVASGQAATLSWSATAATGCTAAGAWYGPKATSGSEATAALRSASTFELTCLGPGGSTSASTTVSLGAQPSLTFAATPVAVQPGETATLTWSAQDATACEASGGWTGSRAVSGSQAVGPLSSDTSFGLTCSGPGGSISRSLQVAMAQSASLSLSLKVNPSQVVYGESTMLTWSSSGASSCAASGAWSGSRPLSGLAISSSLISTSTFSIECRNGLGQVQAASATVKVLPPAPSGPGTTPGVSPAPVVSLVADATEVMAGKSVKLAWSSQNATDCRASGAWQGARAVQGNETVGPLSTNSSFGLTCTGPGGSQAAAVNVTVTTPPPQSKIALSAAPAEVPVNGSATLNWSGTNVTSCTASGGWSGARAINGSTTVGPLADSIDFVLSCTGSSGEVVSSVRVEVLKPPVVRLSLTPSTIATGSRTTLSWSAQGATQCTAGGGWTGPRPTSGEEESSALYATTTFDLACDGPSGRTTKSVSAVVSSSGKASGSGSTKADSSGGGSEGGGGAVDWLLLAMATVAGVAGRRRAHLPRWLNA
jgi:hypothetical protein